MFVCLIICLFVQCYTRFFVCFCLLINRLVNFLNFVYPLHTRVFGHVFLVDCFVSRLNLAADAGRGKPVGFLPVIVLEHLLTTKGGFSTYESQGCRSGGCCSGSTDCCCCCCNCCCVNVRFPPGNKAPALLDVDNRALASDLRSANAPYRDETRGKIAICSPR